MARPSNHNSRHQTAPTWADILAMMREMQGAHKCYIQVLTTLGDQGAWAGEMEIQARAIDWADGLTGKPIEVFRISGWARQYNSYPMAVYTALLRLDMQLDDRWRWGDGERNKPPRG